MLNITDNYQVFEDYPKFDFVYHLAAEYGRWNGEAYYENLRMTNMIGTKNILEFQIKYGFKLCAPSCEVYGDYEGFMTENVMVDNVLDTYQMNDYAITKWAGELMCLNATSMHGNEIVRVRPLNCYGPHEHYTPYRGFIPKFIYLSLTKQPYTVFKGHKRIIDYVEIHAILLQMSLIILSQVKYIMLRLREMDIKEYSDIVLNVTGGDPLLVTYKESEKFTTKIKTVDFSNAIRDLDHDPKVDPYEGIKRTSEWMKNEYRL